MARTETLSVRTFLDDGGFSESLKKITSALRDNRLEYGLASSAARAYGTSADQLKAKADYLTANIADQRKKVETLREAFKKAKSEKGDDSKVTEKLRQDYIKAQTALNNFEGQLRQTNSQLEESVRETKKSGDAAEDASKKWSSFKSGLGKVAKGVGIAVGALATAAGAAVTGAYKLTESASDLSEAQNVVSQTFKTSGKQVNEWAKTMSTTAGISQTNATKFVGSMGAMLKSSGLTEDAAASMSEQLVQLTGDMSSFYNLDNETAWEKIRAGISGETEPLKQLGINMNVANLEAYALSQGINKAYSEMSQAEQTTLRYNYLLSVTKDAQGDFGRTLETSFANQVRVAKMQIQDFGTQLGQKFLPVFMDVMKGVNDGIKSGNFEEVGSSIADGLTNALNKIVEMLPKYIDAGISLISGLIQGIADSLPAIATAAIDLISKLAMKLVEMLPMIVDAGLKVVIALIQGIAEAIPQLIPAIVSAIQQIILTLINNLPLIIDAGIKLIKALVQGLLTAIPQIVEALPQIISALINALMEAIPLVLESAADIITALIDGLIGAIPTLIAAIPKIIQAIITGLVNGLPKIIESAVDIIDSLITGIIDNLPTLIAAIPDVIIAIITGITENLPTLIEAMPRIIVSIIKGIAENLWQLIKHAPEIIWAIIKGLGQALWELVKAGGDLISSIWDGIKSAWESVKKWFSDAISGIGNFFSGLWSSFTKWGKNVIDGIWNGLKSAWNSVVQWFKDAWNWIEDGWNKFWGIHSPSTRMAAKGKFMAQGLGIGFTNAMKRVRADMEKEMGRVDGTLNLTPSLPASGRFAAVAGAGTSGMAYNQTVNITVNGKASPIETARQIELQSRLLALEF